MILSNIMIKHVNNPIQYVYYLVTVAGTDRLIASIPHLGEGFDRVIATVTNSTHGEAVLSTMETDAVNSNTFDILFVYERCQVTWLPYSKSKMQFECATIN